MHPSSYAMMKLLLSQHLPADNPLHILDVGAMDVNGGYRPLMAPAWKYTGCDIAPGANVDLVQLSPYHIQDQAADYDVVISGQCLEHVEMPFLLVREIARVLKPCGLCFLVAPWTWPVHRFLLDCWRILPDGMAAMLRFAGLTPIIDPFINANDCWGVARK